MYYTCLMFHIYIRYTLSTKYKGKFSVWTDSFYFYISYQVFVFP